MDESIKETAALPDEAAAVDIIRSWDDVLLEFELKIENFLEKTLK